MKKVLISMILIISMALCSFFPSTQVRASNLEEEVIIYQDDKIVILEKYIPGDFVIDQYDMQPAAWAGYSIRNIRSTGTTTKNIIISDDIIAAGGSKTFSLSSTLETSVNGVLSIGPKDFNISAGLSASSSVTISKSYTYACPTDLNGERVHSCRVVYYPRLTKYAFDEYFLEIKSGDGTAEALTGFHQIVTMTYK